MRMELAFLKNLFPLSWNDDPTFHGLDLYLLELLLQAEVLKEEVSEAYPEEDACLLNDT